MIGTGSGLDRDVCVCVCVYVCACVSAHVCGFVCIFVVCLRGCLCVCIVIERSYVLHPSDVGGHTSEDGGLADLVTASAGDEAGHAMDVVPVVQLTVQRAARVSLRGNTHTHRERAEDSAGQWRRGSLSLRQEWVYLSLFLGIATVLLSVLFTD